MNQNPEHSSNQSFPAQGRLAGIDFGTVRIGIAVSDIGQIIASPYEVYRRRSLDLDAKYFQELVARNKWVGFVVGLPVHMSGDESQKSREAVAFANGWARRRACQFDGWMNDSPPLPPERFSTHPGCQEKNGKPNWIRLPLRFYWRPILSPQPHESSLWMIKDDS